MSIQFNDTTNYKGLVQFYEKECGFPRGTISGDDNKLKDFAAEVNVTFDEFISIAIPASGKWQFHDSNHEGYPIIYTNLVSGQQDYPITVDDENNLVLDIYKVAILPSATATLYEEIYPVDPNSESDAHGLISDDTTTSIPQRYDKLSNGILLDPIPGYNATNGLKVYVNTEASYFSYADTTKKPGVPGNLHAYFFLKPALNYARRNSLANLVDLEKAVRKYEGSKELRIPGLIELTFAGRQRDARNRLEAMEIPYE